MINDVVKKFFSVFIFLSVTIYLQAQNHLPEYSDQQRFVIYTGIGGTCGFNDFKQASPQYEEFKRVHKWRHNLGLGVKFFHKNRWVSDFRYGYYSSIEGVEIYHPYLMISPNFFGGVGKGFYTGIGYDNFGLMIGRRKILNQTRWQINWLAGLNTMFVYNGIRPRSPASFSPELTLDFEEPIHNEGFNFSLQAAYEIAFRGKYMGLSLKAMGNLGLQYFVETKYIARVKEDRYSAVIKNKGDFVAVMLQYEVYLFNRKNQ